MAAPAGVPQVTVDGSALPARAAALLELTVVEDHVMLPARFELHFRDPGATVLEESGLRIAAEVAIAVATESGAAQELVRGDVAALEAEYDGDGSRVVARGFDRTHRLTRGARTESYRDVTDADVLRALAGRASVPLGRIEDPGIVHPTLQQVGVSDWAFLHDRARTLGYTLAMRDGRLDFAPPPAADDAPEPGGYEASDPLQLVLGRNLVSFRLSLSAATQVGSVEVRGWDPTRRGAVVGRSGPRAAVASASADPQRLASAVGSPEHARLRASFTTQAEVDAAAAAAAEDIGAASVEADGVAAGDPALRAGRAISVGRVGTDFEGRYVLTSTRHQIDARGYRTRFTISGRRDSSLAGLLHGMAAGERRRMPSVATGIVSNVDDPDGHGRVKVHLPWLGDEIESDWLRATQLLAGPGHGAAFLPEVGDEVLIAFERGDAHRGFVLGALFNGVDTAAVDGAPVASGRVLQRGISTPGGHKLVFVDGGAETRVVLGSGGELTLEASRGLKLTAGGDLEVEATGNLKLRANRGVAIDAGGGVVDIKGVQINLG